jgi:hypothetical protein
MRSFETTIGVLHPGGMPLNLRKDPALMGKTAARRGNPIATGAEPPERLRTKKGNPTTMLKPRAPTPPKESR